jgi:hypothetical protein
MSKQESTELLEILDGDGDGTIDCAHRTVTHAASQPATLSPSCFCVASEAKRSFVSRKRLFLQGTNLQVW